MTVDEKTIKRLIQEVLSEMNEQNCNVPIIKENQTFQEIEGISSVVPTWDVVFTCHNPADKTDMYKAKFSIETPQGKSEKDIKTEISRILDKQIGKDKNGNYPFNKPKR